MNSESSPIRSRMESAIDAFESVLDWLPREKDLYEWASMNSFLAAAYWKLLQSEDMVQIMEDSYSKFLLRDKLAKAIQYAESALEVLTPKSFTDEWKAFQPLVDEIYAYRDKFEKVLSDEAELRDIESGLDTWRQAKNQEYVLHQLGRLAELYENRNQGDFEENLTKAIEYQSQAIDVLNKLIEDQSESPSDESSAAPAK